MECHGGEPVPGAACAACGHFLTAVALEDGNTIAVRCVFLETDPACAIMTLVDELAVVDERETVEVARRRARTGGASHLVVTSGGEVVGVVSADRLARAPAGDAVGARVTPPVRVIGTTTSLAAVARMLGDRRLDYLLVVDREEVKGIVTRADLRRANIPCGAIRDRAEGPC